MLDWLYSVSSSVQSSKLFGANDKGKFSLVIWFNWSLKWSISFVVLKYIMHAYFHVYLTHYMFWQKLIFLTAVSQVEHGVFHLLDANNAQITVVVDCEGLSPLKIPMQVMRTCSSLLQDHFPNRLGCLFVIQLPPVLRVIAQTFIQVSLLLWLGSECLIYGVYRFSFVLWSSCYDFSR